MAKARFASLTAGLLARKGEAHPAAESFAVMAGNTAADKEPRLVRAHSGMVSRPINLHDELEWMTSMGPGPSAPSPKVVRSEVPPPRLVEVPKPKPSLVGANALLARIGKPVHPPASQESVPAPSRRISVSVRLDEPRYMRLKLAAMQLQRTSQDLMTKAIDAYLTALGIAPLTEDEMQMLRSASAKATP